MASNFSKYSFHLYFTFVSFTKINPLLLFITLAWCTSLLCLSLCFATLKNSFCSSLVSNFSYSFSISHTPCFLPLSLLFRAYQDFCNTILAAAKRSIPRGRRKNYRPCWDAECEQLYQTFLWELQGKATNIAASALLARLDEKRKERWSEAVNTIDFTYTSRLAWNTINKLTGRSRNSRRPCSISANCIASQLIKNGVCRTKDHEPGRLVAKEVSKLWKIQTLLVKVSLMTSRQSSSPVPYSS